MCTLGSGPKVKSSVVGGITGVRPQSKVECLLGSGPKVKSQATVLWRQTRELRQTHGAALETRAVIPAHYF